MRYAATLTLTAFVIAGSISQLAFGVDHKKSGSAPEFATDKEIAALFDKVDQLSFSEKKRAIEAFRANTSGSSAKHKSAYALGRLLEKGGTTEELTQAIPLYTEASAAPALYERTQLHIADCANTLGNEQLVRSSLSNVISRSTDAKTRAQAMYGLAQSYMRTSEQDKAADELTRLIKIAPYTQFAIGARYYLGQIAFQKKDEESVTTALTYWREYLAKSPDGRFARDIVNTLNADSTLPLTPADHALFAEVNYANGNYARALEEWGKGQAPSKWFKQANCLIRLSRKEEGKEAMFLGLKSHPTDPSVLDAAKVLARIGTKAEAIEVWKTVLTSCPKFGDVALYNLAIRAPEESTLSYYQQIARDYPDSDYAPESAWWTLWNSIKNGGTPLTEMQKYASKYENAKSGSRFSFWVGKLEEKLQHKEAAIVAYQKTASKYGNHYYGWRAKERIAALNGKNDQGWSTSLEKNLAHYPRIAAAGGWQWPEPPQLVSYQKIANDSSPTVATLAEIHQWDECLDQLPKDKVRELRALCLAKMNLPMEAINTVSREVKGNPNSDPKWQIAYPLLHSSMIASEAEAKKVDPFLAQALIREESRYNVQAISSSNAIGLMQLLPGTAMGVAKRLGVKINNKSEIHKPENNIKFGVDYLSYTLGRHDGNALFAVASYNGGPNAVASWRKKIPTVDLDYFVENIPFTETRDYVRKVFGSYWNYSKIYGTQALSMRT